MKKEIEYKLSGLTSGRGAKTQTEITLAQIVKDQAKALEDIATVTPNFQKVGHVQGYVNLTAREAIKSTESKLENL